MIKIQSFFNLLGFVKKIEKMTTNLANRLFSQFFITIGNISPNHINSTNTVCDTIGTNLIAYITTNQYLSDKFYRLMIDTNAFKYFTMGYKQFMAFTRDIKYTTIDIFKVGAIYVQFGICSILYIGSVLIQKPIRHIKFYIVKANTFFLLCLVNMDHLNVYFNNINKLLVMKSMCILVIHHFDHLFLLWENSLNFFITQSFDHNLCYLIETELCQLHEMF